MDIAQIIVTLAGAALIAFILWFFFGPRQAVAARQLAAGAQEVEVEVRSSYVPDRIEGQAGRPIRIRFRRDDPNPCTAQVVFPDFGIVKDLPLGREIMIEVTPPAPGEYEFHCGMNMVHGKLIAK
jgi:plastocyanin domain-containing protein